MNAIIKALIRTDYKLLKKQKITLLKTITYLEQSKGNGLCSEDLEGILNFIDAIQDAVVEDEIKTEQQVFGRM